MELFKKFEWSKVASLALDGHKYSEYISHLQDVLQQNDVTFIANRKFPVESPDMSMVSYPLRLMSGCVNWRRDAHNLGRMFVDSGFLGARTE